ncbi:hypothetical protein CYMTET_27627, partial [Cymbomonas tetramitiformis]
MSGWEADYHPTIEERLLGAAISTSKTERGSGLDASMREFRQPRCRQKDMGVRVKEKGHTGRSPGMSASRPFPRQAGERAALARHTTWSADGCLPQPEDSILAERVKSRAAVREERLAPKRERSRGKVNDEARTGRQRESRVEIVMRGAEGEHEAGRKAVPGMREPKVNDEAGTGEGQPGAPGRESKDARKAMQYAERKALFFCSWANEQPADLLQTLRCLPSSWSQDQGLGQWQGMPQ